MKTFFVAVLGIAGFALAAAPFVRPAAWAQEVPADAKLVVEKAAATQALRNVKVLCTGCLMKTADENGVFKIGPNTFKNDVGPYVTDKTMFTSPLDKPGTASYQFNKALQNVGQNKVKKPDQTVMVYEGTWGKPLFRHHGMAIIGFADGHAKLYAPATAKGLLWKP